MNILKTIIELYKKISNFEYGYISSKTGEKVYPDKTDNYLYYNLSSIDDFEKNKIGTCYDTNNWLLYNLNNIKCKAEAIHIRIMNKSKLVFEHVFTYVDNKYIIEPSYKKIKGIYLVYDLYKYIQYCAYSALEDESLESVRIIVRSYNYNDSKNYYNVHSWKFNDSIYTNTRPLLYNCKFTYYKDLFNLKLKGELLKLKDTSSKIYHGSSTKISNKMTPTESYSYKKFGKIVFGTIYKKMAITFGTKWRDNNIRLHSKKLSGSDYEFALYMISPVEYDKPAYLYELDNDDMWFEIVGRETELVNFNAIKIQNCTTYISYDMSLRYNNIDVYDYMNKKKYDNIKDWHAEYEYRRDQ